MKYCFYKFVCQDGAHSPVYVYRENLWQAYAKFFSYAKGCGNVNKKHYSAQPLTQEEFMNEFDPEIHQLLNR